MESFLKNFYRGLGRVFPDCLNLSQAIAFNMFLAFFPVLLLALGILSSSSTFHNVLRELPERLRMIVPSGSEDIVSQYFVRKGQHPWKWFLLGLGGTLIAGSQVMVGFMAGFRTIEGDQVRPAYWRGHLRALLLLLLTFLPALVVVILTVFGKQARGTLIHTFGVPALFNALAFVFQAAIVFTLSMVVLVLLYRVGRPEHRGWRRLLPRSGVRVSRRPSRASRMAAAPSWCWCRDHPVVDGRHRFRVLCAQDALRRRLRRSGRRHRFVDLDVPHRPDRAPRRRL